MAHLFRKETITYIALDRTFNLAVIENSQSIIESSAISPT